MLDAQRELTNAVGRLVSFGDVVHNCGETTPDPAREGIERYVGLEHLEPGSLTVERWGDITEGTTFTRQFKPGQVLFGKRRAYQRKAAVADFTGVCSGDILVFQATEGLLPAILPFIVQSDAFVEHALRTSAGSLSPRTKWADLAQFQFRLPPMDVQHRAVNLLRSLEQMLAGIRRSRAAADLAARALIADAIGTEPGTAKWPTATVAEVGAIDRQPVQVGPFGGSLASRHFTVTGIPVLKINNISQDGRLALDDLVYVAPDYAQGLSRYAVEEGDLVTAAQATIGRSALVSKDAAGALISQHLIRVALNPELCLPPYLVACFQSPLIKRQMHAVKAKTTRDGLNTADVASFSFPLPPLSEQRGLVSRVQRIEKLRDASEVRLADVLRLRHALVETILGTNRHVH